MAVGQEAAQPTPVQPVPSSSISFASRIPDADGIQRDVTFAGSVDAGVLAGIVTIEGNDLVVIGTVTADNSVSGMVTLSNGDPLGSFQGWLSDGQLLRMTYDMGGRSGTCSSPPVSALVAGAASTQ
jgi:hypothetical protein